MSRVFLAEETALQRKVVIKVLPPELAAEVNAERFRREIQLAAKLQHPYIVPVLTTGVAGGLPYFTMPFVEGESLRAHLQKTGELPVAEAIGILRDVLEALAYAHECGVVHRDIKPENVLLARHHAHVADFGVAKALSASTNAQSGLTSLGVALGTPAYMAPEQAMADPTTDHRADLYAVGAMAYEMLTGYQVFSQRSPQAMLAAHATENPEPVERRRPSIPAALAALVMRLLEKRPADRVQSANDALAMLSSATTPSGGMAPTAQYATVGANAPSRNRAALWTAVAVGIALVIAGGAFAVKRRGTSTADASSQPPSIAVMPFENMSGDPKNDYLGDGLSEELIGGLSRVRGLLVAARTSSFAFKGKDEDVRRIGSKLGVGSVLGGSVRRAGNKLRVSVQLTNVSNGFNLWSETYDRDMSDVFAVEDEISKAIVNALAVRLAGSQNGERIVQQTTRDPVAYDLYLKGRYAWQQRGAHLYDAKKYFQDAIAKDSGFALAWSGLADTYATMASWGYVTPREAASVALDFARKAVALDSMAPETHISLGFTLCNLQALHSEGLAEMERAIRLNPSLAVSRYFHALCLTHAGRLREALAEGLEARRRDPLNAQMLIAPGRAYIALGQNDSAIALLMRGTAISPNLASLYATIIYAYAGKGDLERMKWAVAKGSATQSLLTSGNRIFGAIVTHDTASVRQLQLEAMKSLDLNAIYFATGYAYAHNADSTLVWLDRAFALKSDLLGFQVYPAFDFVRGDPRYLALQKKYDLAVPLR